MVFSAFSGSFYVHRHKPEFCELFVICGGKLISLGEENGEGIMEEEWENYVKEMENYFQEILSGKCEEDGPEVEKGTSLGNSQEEQVMPKNVVRFFIVDIVLNCVVSNCSTKSKDI